MNQPIAKMSRREKTWQGSQFLEFSALDPIRKVETSSNLLPKTILNIEDEAFFSFKKK